MEGVQGNFVRDRNWEFSDKPVGPGQVRTRRVAKEGPGGGREENMEGGQSKWHQLLAEGAWLGSKRGPDSQCVALEEAGSLGPLIPMPTE